MLGEDDVSYLDSFNEHLRKSSIARGVNAHLKGAHPPPDAFDPLLVMSHHKMVLMQDAFSDHGITGNPDSRRILNTSVDEASGEASTSNRNSGKTIISSPLLLRIGIPDPGVIFQGVICAPPSRAVGIHTIARAEDGSYVKISIYNFVSHETKRASACALFPVGATIRISDPYLKRFGDGMFGLRVDNPQNLELIYPAPEPGETAESLRLRGNRKYDQEDFYGAKLDYTFSHMISPSHVALSNRAEIELHLANWRSAQRDALEAIELDPNFGKSHWRLGRSLCGMGAYAEAIQSIEMAKTKGCSGPAVEAKLAQCRTLAAQASTGDYDWKTIFETQRDRPETLVLADFQGPVRVQEGKFGRGMIATRDIKPGELLIVANPIVRASAGEKSVIFAAARTAINIQKGSQVATLTDLCRVCMDDPWILRAVYSLSDGRTVDAERLPVPSPATRTHQDPNEEKIMLNVNRLRRIILTNTFSVHSTSGLDKTALYHLPSFLNHSCVSNAMWTLVGEVMVIRACRPIRENDEVTIQYRPFEERADVAKRRQQLRQWGFECSCSLCTFEDRWRQELVNLRRRVEPLLEQGRELMQAGKLHSACKVFTSAIDDYVEPLASEVPRWEQGLLRGLFCTYYFGQRQSAEVVLAVPVVLAIQDRVIEMMQAFSPYSPDFCTTCEVLLEYAMEATGKHSKLTRTRRLEYEAACRIRYGFACAKNWDSILRSDMS